MQKPNIRSRIRAAAFDLLGKHPGGLRYSELHRFIHKADPSLNLKTITSSIWNLDAVIPDRVYKPVKGLYRLTSFKELGPQEETTEDVRLAPLKIREEQFYPLFAAWLKNDLEEVTHAIALGGNIFRDRWGTPDVLGKNESRRSDVIKGPTSIVSAEIKIDLSGLVTGFGQACAYRLFSHKSYLVIPKQTPAEELTRIESLCQMFGLGLVVFNPKSVSLPDFRLVIRPIKSEPDLFYTNRYIKQVEKELFL